jgi:hypothetical protein
MRQILSITRSDRLTTLDGSWSRIDAQKADIFALDSPSKVGVGAQVTVQGRLSSSGPTSFMLVDPVGVVRPQCVAGVSVCVRLHVCSQTVDGRRFLNGIGR